MLANILWPLGGAALLGSAAALRTGRGREWRLLAVAGLGLLAAECALERAWFTVAWNAVLIAVILGTDWWNRKGRKAAKALGLKSRAVLAGLVEKAREAGAPLPEGVPG